MIFDDMLMFIDHARSPTAMLNSITINLYIAITL